MPFSNQSISARRAPLHCRVFTCENSFIRQFSLVVFRECEQLGMNMAPHRIEDSRETDLVLMEPLRWTAGGDGCARNIHGYYTFAMAPGPCYTSQLKPAPGGCVPNNESRVKTGSGCGWPVLRLKGFRGQYIYWITATLHSLRSALASLPPRSKLLGPMASNPALWDSSTGFHFTDFHMFALLASASQSQYLECRKVHIRSLNHMHHCGKEYRGLGDALQVLMMRGSRNQVPSRFLSYAHADCNHERESAFERIIQILPQTELSRNVLCIGLCCGKHPELRTRAYNDPSGLSNAFNPSLLGKHRFSLSLEQNFEATQPNYSSEKLLFAYRMTAVPIWHGPLEGVSQIFDPATYIYWEPKHPEPAMARIRYLESNRTAFAELVSRPFFLPTAEKEFMSMHPSVGNGILLQRLLDFVWGSEAPRRHNSSDAHFGAMARSMLTSRGVWTLDRTK